MEFNPDKKSNLPSVEELRMQYTEKVKQALEKYKDEIKDLAIFTSSAKNGNGFNQTKDLSFVKYKEEHDSDYEVKGTPKDMAHSIGNIEEPTYIYHNKMNWGSFYAPLGSCLHTPDRTGNMIGVSIKGEKGKRFNQELTNSIFDLIKTIKQSKNLKEIAKEALPVFKAFKEISETFQTTSGNHFTAQQMIEEFEEILKS